MKAKLPSSPLHWVLSRRLSLRVRQNSGDQLSANV
jgi:hypothetical protein